MTFFLSVLAVGQVCFCHSAYYLFKEIYRCCCNDSMASVEMVRLKKQRDDNKTSINAWNWRQHYWRHWFRWPMHSFISLFFRFDMYHCWRFSCTLHSWHDAIQEEEKKKKNNRQQRNCQPKRPWLKCQRTHGQQPTNDTEKKATTFNECCVKEGRKFQTKAIKKNKSQVRRITNKQHEKWIRS